MKKAIYLIIISMITCVCIGLGVSRHMLGLFSFNIGTSGTKTVSGSEKLEEFSGINIDVDVADVNIVIGENYSISYEGSKSLEPVINVANGNLTVKQKSVKINTDANLKCKITVTVPVDIKLDDVSVSVDAGKINVQDLTIRDLVMEADAGNLKLTNCVIGRGNIDVDAGDIDINDSTIEKSEVSADAGNIKMDNIEFDSIEVKANMGNIRMDLPLAYEEYSYDLNVDLGAATVGGEKFKGFVSKEENNGSYKIKATCNLGNIDINVK
ncbi:MAG: DUF4097 family beta strand repeat-containing protein [Lachnospiraceae bacterium]